jgi:cell division protein FtsB
VRFNTVTAGLSALQQSNKSLKTKNTIKNQRIKNLFKAGTAVAE